MNLLLNVEDIYVIQSYPFFVRVNWCEYYNKKIIPPFIPEIKEEIYLKTNDKTRESLKIKRNNEDINIKNNENEDLI